jgi:hypothetical protein
MTSKKGVVMLRNEVSIRELFYRSCTADRSFVPQDDRKINYVIGSGKSEDSEDRITYIA